MKKLKIIKITISTCLYLALYSCINSNTHNSNNNNKIIPVEVHSPNDTSGISQENEIIGGWLKESIDQRIVIQKLGIPEIKGKDEYWSAISAYIQRWEYISLGIILEMESDSQNTTKSVFSITIMNPCKLTTSQGVGIDSSEVFVREKYSGIIDVANSSDKSILIGSIYGGTLFSLQNGKVSQIFIGALAE